MATILKSFDFDRLTWEKALLDIMASRAKHVWTLGEMYARIEQKPFITPRHLEETYDRPRYQHAVRAFLADLKQDGKVRHVGRGLYSLK